MCVCVRAGAVRRAGNNKNSAAVSSMLPHRGREPDQSEVRRGVWLLLPRTLTRDDHVEGVGYHPECRCSVDRVVE